MKDQTENTVERDTPRRPRAGERGYALVALIGVMMFSLILTTAAAPELKRDTQREREEEMLWRGQQVAWAISRFKQVRGTYPTDLRDLVQGFEINLKKIRLLRPSALCDPMTPCEGGGPNWRLVHPGDPLPKELLDAYLAMQQKGTMVLPPPPPDLVILAQMGARSLPGQPSSGQLGGGFDSGLGQAGQIGQPGQGGQIGAPGVPGLGQTIGLGDSDSSDDKLKKLPIVGVVSKKADRMFRSYYGIEEYDHTLFFPSVPVLVGGFVNPLALGAAVAGGSGRDPNCPNGGVMIDGRCWGNLIPGQIKRPEPQQ